MLADLGATVIKVENPGGGDFARHYDDVVKGQAHFVWCNRGKQSITLDLKAMRDWRFCTGFSNLWMSSWPTLAPGATGRMGLTPDELAKRHPDLISVEIDGYGPAVLVTQAGL